MRVVILAAGAAGMYCGSCIRDNRLAATLRASGRDALLVPLYTPVRTDEIDVSEARIYYGGINVYLQQKFALFRRLPRLFDRWLDAASLLGRVGRMAARTRPEELGQLTVSVLRGEHGPQRKELAALLDALAQLRPALVNLPNLLFLGVAQPIRERLNIPVVCTLSGEDIFTDGLPEPHRAQTLQLIHEQSRHVDAFVAVTRYFADFAADHYRLPVDRVHHVPLGIDVTDFADAPHAPRAHGARAGAACSIVYLARVCRAKGLHNLVAALPQIARLGVDARVRAAGYLSESDRRYLEQIQRDVRQSGIVGRFEYVGEPSRAEKIALLRSADIFCVPTEYRESKGLYVLEALASAAPVVLPQHGAFIEHVRNTGGGLLYDATDRDALAATLAQLARDPQQRAALGAAGRDAVRQSHTDRIMAERTWELYEQLVKAPHR